MNEEEELSRNLRQFLHCLIYGPNKIQTEYYHERKRKIIKTIPEVIVVTASSGKKKSVTGSKRMT